MLSILWSMKRKLTQGQRVRIVNSLSRFHKKVGRVRTRFTGGTYVVDPDLDSERFPRGLTFHRSELVPLKDVQ